MFEHFQWYDFVVIGVFASILQTLVFIALFVPGLGLMSGIVIWAIWNGWEWYERFRAHSDP